MNKLETICIITDGYPTEKEPTRYAFVDQLACAFADMGKHVHVLSSVPYGAAKKYGFVGTEWVRTTDQGNQIHVHQPRCISLSNLKIGPINMGRYTEYLHIRSLRKQLKVIARLDCLYAHFLNSGMISAKLGDELSIPSFCAFGESGLWSIAGKPIEDVRLVLDKLNGIISVSTENQRLLENNKLFDPSRIVVLPNAVNDRVFFPHDRIACRKQLGLPENGVIGIFVGSFCERKGPLRVAQASARVKDLKMIYLGRGEQIPNQVNCLFCGSVSHQQLPKYLSAADFFVLPTQAEGCCNAIVEAMACGLPIISSDGEFNNDILSDEYAFRIPANDVDALSKAIERITHDEQLRGHMSRAAQQAAKAFTLTVRAKKIIDFMENNT